MRIKILITFLTPFHKVRASDKSVRMVTFVHSNFLEGAGSKRVEPAG